MSRATRARRKRLRAMTRGRRSTRYSTETFGTLVTPHGTLTVHLVPRAAAWAHDE